MIRIDTPRQRRWRKRYQLPARINPTPMPSIVSAVVRAVSIPVTLKIRSGPDAARETAVEVARLAEDAGAAAVDVHARSVAQARPLTPNCMRSNCLGRKQNSDQPFSIAHKGFPLTAGQ